MPYKNIAYVLWGILLMLWGVVFRGKETSVFDALLLVFISIPISISAIFFTITALLNSKKNEIESSKNIFFKPIILPKIFSSARLFFGLSFFLILFILFQKNWVSNIWSSLLMGPLALGCLLIGISKLYHNNDNQQ